MKHRDLFKESLKNLKPVPFKQEYELSYLCGCPVETSSTGKPVAFCKLHKVGSVCTQEQYAALPAMTDLRLKAFKQTSAYLDKFQMPASAHGARCKLEEKARQATENPEDFEQCPEPETEA